MGKIPHQQQDHMCHAELTKQMIRSLPNISTDIIGARFRSQHLFAFNLHIVKTSRAADPKWLM
jgi:hypothetical protein